MDILQYFLDHYVMLTEMIGLFVMLQIGVHLSKHAVKATRVSIALILLESVLWSLEEWTEYQPGMVLPRFLLAAGIYCMHPVIIVSITEALAPLGRKLWYLLLPLLVYIPVMFTSQWTHLVFYISPENRWLGGDYGLSWLPYIVFLAYAAAFMVLFIVRYARYSWRTVMVPVYIILTALLGVLINVFRHEDVDYATLFSSVLILHYLFLYTHLSKTDSLTGLLNRQSFYHDLETAQNRLSAVCSADMNDLKWINDSFGHEAGDLALKTMAEVLDRDAGAAKTVYRIGGDEFMILYYGKSTEEVEADIAQMREALSKTKYVCAFGYAKADVRRDLEELLSDADQAMYADKARLKREVLAAGGQLHRRADD